MAHPNTHRAQVKSLFKKGMLTQKQHDRMMANLESETAALPASGNGDPAMTAAATPAQAAQVPATASVPGSPNQQGDVTAAQQPPAA